jgi:hypothetical protein
MIQVSQNGLLIGNDLTIIDLQEEFASKHCIVLPRFIEEKLLQKMMDNLQGASFEEKIHISEENTPFATDQSLQGNNIVLHQLHMLLNNKALFKLIENIAQIHGVLGFSGRIYSNLPGLGHHLDWHDDTVDKSRMVGISINLSKEKYTGGVFQLRSRNAEEFLKEVPCGNPGDAHIFRVSPQLQHRVTETEGIYPRTAAAGWFISESFSGILHS